MTRRRSPPALFGALIERAGLRRASRPDEPPAVEEAEPAPDEPRFPAQPVTPRPRRALARAVQRVAQPSPRQEPPAPPPPREWNLWELERLAREHSGNADRAEEWTALFVHLRVFANADGVLPKEFDRLVRESFAQLIEAA